MRYSTQFSGSITQLKPQTVQRVTFSTQIEARVSIRFMRMGRIHRPFYRVVAIDSRKRRESKPLEFLGWYNPMTKETKLNAPSIKKWLSFGAKTSDTLTMLLKRAMII